MNVDQVKPRGEVKHIAPSCLTNGGMTQTKPYIMGLELIVPTMKNKTDLKRLPAMSLKKLDDEASKDFWDFVQKSTKDWREQQPAWSRELEHSFGEEPDRSLSVEDEGE